MKVFCVTCAGYVVCLYVAVVVVVMVMVVVVALVCSFCFVSLFATAALSGAVTDGLCDTLLCAVLC